jgi:putative salt-induced outer membrane protein YdiY
MTNHFRTPAERPLAMPTSHWHRRFCLWALIAAAWAGMLPAQEISDTDERFSERLVLRHGETLTGRSLAINNGVLLWMFFDGIQLTIPLSDIERLEIGSRDDDSLETSGPTLTDPMSVLGENSPNWTQYVPLAPHLQQTYNAASETAATWTQRIQVGGQFNDGNTQTDLIDVAGVFERNTPDQMRQIDVGGQWGRSQSQQTANRWWVNTNFDWPVHDKWITFVTSKNEYNQPAHLDYRGTLSTGMGYRFFFEDKRRLIARFGPAYTLEIFESPSNTRQTPDLFGEIEARWPLFARTSLDQKMRVQPSMLDAELIRVFSTTGVSVDLDERDRWKLRVALQYQYISQPNPGRVPSDYMTTVSLVYLRK